MSEAGVHKLNCAECGAGLDVLGGGRVKTHVCSYCGAELDAQDDYKVIQKFRDMTRPETPFDLGMTGTLWGAEFTIIGTMAWAEYYRGKSWHWVDHQVFSPTHGYAWLSVENGHVTFTRKSREASTPAGISETKIENSENRPMVKFQGKTFRYYGSGRASPTFIEGEFNFRPSMEDSIRYVALMGGDRMLDIVESGHELEYDVTELPDQAALLSSFGVEPGRRPRPKGIHPLDAMERTPLQSFTRNLAIAATVVALLLGISLAVKGDQIAASGTTNVRNDIELPFEITKGTGLTEIRIDANANNSWAWFEAELADATGTPVAAFERGIEYYSGSDWSEGRRYVTTRLDLPPGAYTLFVSMAEAEVDWRGGVKASNMSASVKQGVANASWMWGTAAIFGLITFLFLGQRTWRYTRRWSGSDWSDD